MPAEEWIHITITGDNKGTSLYVNGRFAEKLEGAKQVFINNKTMARVQTLFFPLQFIADKTNAFDGVIDDVKVFNCILPAEKISLLAKRAK